MPREDHFEELFEDLEQQAAGLHLAERDAELADRGVAEYAAVELAGRLHASVGRPVRATVAGVGTLHGTLRRAGAGWFLLEAPSGDWAVSTAAVERLQGLSPQSVTEPLRGIASRLALGSVLRGLAQSGGSAVVHHLSGDPIRVRVLRVGADFVEVLPEGAQPAGAAVVLPLARVAALRLG